MKKPAQRATIATLAAALIAGQLWLFFPVRGAEKSAGMQWVQHEINNRPGRVFFSSISGVISLAPYINDTSTIILWPEAGDLNQRLSASAKEAFGFNQRLPHGGERVLWVYGRTLLSSDREARFFASQTEKVRVAYYGDRFTIVEVWSVLWQSDTSPTAISAK